MTARVCPVHGEYAADGVCRWCEPEAIRSEPVYVVRPVEQVVGKETAAAKAPPKTITEYDWTRGPEVEDPATLPLAVCSFDLEVALQELWRRMQARAAKEPVCVPDFDAESARLLAQHAALRWERVARRWEAKHPSKWMKLDRSDLRTEQFEKLLVDSFLRWFYGLEPKP